MKRKRLLRLLAALTVIAALAGGLYLMIPRIASLKFRNDTLKRCYVSTGGGMLGGYSSASLQRKGDTAVLTVRKKETHEDREVTTVYAVSPDAFDRLREIAVEYDLYAGSKKGLSPFQVMDGDTTSVDFDFEKGSFTVSDNQALTRKMSQGLREAEKYLWSLATGNGETTVEPQRAMLYLRSGYTLSFTVCDAFDGRLDGILGEEREVGAYGDCGILLCSGEEPDLTGAEPEDGAGAGCIIYDPAEKALAVLYGDLYERKVYVVAYLDGYPNSACPLIEEMEGAYRLHFN